MRHDDTTTTEYQRTFRGRHKMPSHGVWSYPSVISGRGVAGTRYLRCPCGWRLVDVHRHEMTKAREQHREHFVEMMKSDIVAGTPVILTFGHPAAGKRGTMKSRRPTGTMTIELKVGGSVEARPSFVERDPYVDAEEKS